MRSETKQTLTDERGPDYIVATIRTDKTRGAHLVLMCDRNTKSHTSQALKPNSKTSGKGSDSKAASTATKGFCTFWNHALNTHLTGTSQQPRKRLLQTLAPVDSPLEAALRENCQRGTCRAPRLKVYLRLHCRWSVSRVLGSSPPPRVLSSSLMELSKRRRRRGGGRGGGWGGVGGWHCLRLKTHLSLIASSPIDYLRPLTPFSVWSLHGVCNPLTELTDPAARCFLMWLAVLIRLCVRGPYPTLWLESQKTDIMVRATEEPGCPSEATGTDTQLTSHTCWWWHL